MRIESLQMSLLEIPFKTSFKHASADRAKTSSVWVEARSSDGLAGYGEGCPREYVTGESIKSALSAFDNYRASILLDVTNLESLKAWIESRKQAIDLDPAAWCATELALLDLFGKSLGQPLEALLSLPKLAGEFQYSAVLGDSAPPIFERQVMHYERAGFRDFKIKLSGVLEKDIEKIACLQNAGSPNRLRADANNLWRSPREVIAYLERLGQPFWAIEEPLAPRDFSGLSTVASQLGVNIILDESFTCAQDLLGISDKPDPWVLNLRVSKLGGLIRSLELLNQARTLDLKVIIGAHVGETSVLSRAGLALAAAAGDARVAMEGAFGTHLLEHDVCDMPIMFGDRGILDPGACPFSTAPGNGLQIKQLRGQV